MDFKGSFECGNGERCDTFTVTDAFSRFVLYCQAIDNLGHNEVERICDALMKKYGVPERIRTDNGTPFSSIISTVNFTIPCANQLPTTKYYDGLVDDAVPDNL